VANAVKKVNTVAIADIKNINTITDTNLKKLNTLEFTGVTDAHTFIDNDLASKGDGSHASLGFTSGIDSTYDVYEFHFINIHPETNGVEFGFQVSTGSGFDQLNITSSVFRTYHSEDGTSNNLGYRSGTDLSNQSIYQKLTEYTGNQGDGSVSGILTLFAPSSGTYVKHFMATVNDMYDATSQSTFYVSGYINTTTAIDEIDFKFSDDEIQGGEIRMYGLAKS